MHANQIVDWKNQLLERAASVFGAESAAAPTVELKELHAKIGQLAFKTDFLADALNGSPCPFCRMGRAGILSAMHIKSDRLKGNRHLAAIC